MTANGDSHPGIENMELDEMLSKLCRTSQTLNRQPLREMAAAAPLSFLN
jgi:hypothetical protein